MPRPGTGGTVWHWHCTDWYGLLIFIAVILVPFVITRNVALAMGIGILLLPLIIWLTTHSASATILAILLGVLVAIKFWPTARAAWARNKNTRQFIFDDGLQHKRSKGS